MDAVPAAAELIKDINTPWQFMALFVVCAFAVLAFWIWKSAGKCKKYTAEVEKREKVEAEVRKAERDRQIDDINKRIEDAFKKSSGVGKSFDAHIKKHDEQDKEIFVRLGAIEKGQIDKSEFSVLQRDVREIDKTVVEIHTIVKERFNKN